MYSVLLTVPAGKADEIAAALSDSHTKGIVEESDEVWRVYFESCDDLQPVLQTWPQLVGESRQEEVVSFLQTSALQDEPVYIGSRFVVTSSPCTEVAGNLLRISVDSVTAFGTGRHETTQMALEVLESIVRPGQLIVDVGCGSGILAQACRLLQPVHVAACDIDENAIAAVRQHFELPVFLGCVEAVASGTADLVLANISKKVVDGLAGEIKRVLKPNGRVLIGGFIEGNPPQLYRPWKSFQKGDWLCWLCQRTDILAAEGAPGQIRTHSLQWW